MCIDDFKELSLSEIVRRNCSFFVFSPTSNRFTRNGRTETVRAVILSNNRRVILDRSHTEVVLFDNSNGECVHSFYCVKY